MKFELRYLTCAIIMAIAFTLVAQDTFTKVEVIVKTSPSPNKGRVVLQSIDNLYKDSVEITFINDYEHGSKRVSKPYILESGGTRTQKEWDVTFNAIIAKPVGSNTAVEIFRVADSEKNTTNREAKDVKQKKNDIAPIEKAGPSPKTEPKKVVVESKTVDILIDTLISGFRTYLDSIPFLSAENINEDSVAISRHITALNLPAIDKSVYIKDENLDQFIKDYTDSIVRYQNDSITIVTGYLDRMELIERRDTCEKIMLTVYRDEIEKRICIIAPLESVVAENASDKYYLDGKYYIVCGGVVLLSLLLVLWYRKANRKHLGGMKKATNNTVGIDSDSGHDDTPSLIVVGAKSTPTLKKQTLDDVYNDESYLKIETGEFCNDSIVRALYIKNSCVKEIYNMYAEDLRNPENPKEDGCMVVGRWVYDEGSGKYDVSLEYTVLPGDDAMFGEYELNFGGKIKLKLSEKLRKLRRDTGLQYDLTCWVHSHPGLGVFFSNSDNSVHHQLKHSVHPGFLTALVIDILTPQQDTGIFTFRDSNEVNSKNDLTKLYSLEEMYQWALASERRSFDANDYFDILKDAKDHDERCFGVQLSNSAIIDMTFLTSKSNGFCGFAHGYLLKRGDRTQCVVSVVNGNENAPNTNLLGCFVVASHCSIPSIRKVMTPYLRDIHFALVYTVSDGLLTAIPIVDNDLVNNDDYYGEKKLEDLKIWTRRKR